MQQDALDRGLGVIRKNYDASAAKGRFKPEQVDQMMGILTPTLNLDDLADCDLIIEAVYENMDVKKDIFGKRSEEHTSELQSPKSISYAVLCLKKNTNQVSVASQLR